MFRRVLGSGTLKGMESKPRTESCTSQELCEAFTYDPDTGVITRKRDGKQMRTLSNRGYTVVNYKNIQMLAHRMAWCMVHGVWPSDEIDHRNHIKTDNRLLNLRSATRSENARNAVRANKFGYRGIQRQPLLRKRPWQAIINLKGKSTYIGGYATAEEAAKAYDKAARAHYGQFAVLNFPEVS